MEIAIGNMVCRHCVSAAGQAISNAGLETERVELGRAVLRDSSVTPERLARLETLLAEEGFELIHDDAARIVEQVKLAVLHHIRDERECRLKLSACIEEHVGVNYDTASRMFSQSQGRTIERYHMVQRIELAKELLAEGKLTLAEIADRAGFSSAAHLSRQFKSVTGMTPTQYIAAGAPRTPLQDA